MTGYIVEVLELTGWKRPNVVQFRFRDAHEFALDRLTDGVTTRAVRILRVTVHEDQPIFAQERPAPIASVEVAP